MESILRTLVAVTLGWIIGQFIYLALMGWAEEATIAASLLNAVGARPQNIIGFSGVYCGDCWAQRCPTYKTAKECPACCRNTLQRRYEHAVEGER